MNMRQFLRKPNAEASLLDYAEAKPKIAQNLKNFAAIAQLVEHNLAKVRVASSSLVCRSKEMFFEYSGRECPGGGIGRRARFRCVCRKVCRFESCSGHSYGEMAELVDALL